MQAPQLNIAGRIAKAFITSKLTIIIIVGVSLAGMISLVLTPREENPQIVVPGATVTATLPGASAEEVEKLIITPLESILSEITGVDHTYGVALNSVGIVTVQFKAGQPKEASLVKLYDRVLASRSRLPADAGSPVVQSLDVDDVPIVTITLASRVLDDYGLKRLADRMAERLQSLSDVSVVTVRGGRSREINIALDPERLEAFNITLSQFYAAFKSSNITLPLQDYIRNNLIEGVKLDGFYTTSDVIQHQIVSINEGRPIYVSDIANVTDGPRNEIEKFSRFGYGQSDQRFTFYGSTTMSAVTIAVAKKKGTNAVNVAKDVISRIEHIKNSIIPSDVEVVVTRDDGKKADDAVNNLVEHLFIAVGTVALILACFLGWREALIVSVTVPMTLFFTMTADLLGGITINRITLYSLILSLGLLVDASIVVIENIYRHYGLKNGASKESITIEATNEIGNATNLATFAVMLVFSSMILLTGMPGQYFFPVTYNVPIAMLASVVIAYIVTPWACNKWLPQHQIDNHNTTNKRSFIERIYLFLFGYLQDNGKIRIAFAFSILLLFTLSILQGGWQFIRPSGVGGRLAYFGVPIGFLPKDNKNTFSVFADLPQNSPIEETNRLVSDLEHLLVTNKYVMNYQSWLGRAGVPDLNSIQKGTSDRTGGYVGEIRVNLIDKHDRDISSIEIVRGLRHSVDEIRKHYPGSDVRLVEDPPGPPLRATVLGEIYGPNLKGIRTLSEQVVEAFGKTYDMVDISNSEPVDIVEQHIIVDKEKAALSSVSVEQIAQALQLVYGGQIISRAHPADEKETVDIRAYVPRRYEIDPLKLDRIYVDNIQGHAVPLSELVVAISSNKDRPIFHKDNERVAFVGGELAKSASLYATLDLNKRLKGLSTPDGGQLTTGNITIQKQDPNVIGGYQLFWDGEMRMMLDTYRDMGLALGAALLLVYLLLVSYYRSFLIPMIAMSSVPLGLIGIFPGHWLLRAEFSSTSMVGIIALAGVVIRNSLLIIDFIRDNVAQGMALEDAVREAGTVRLRPILLTTLAIILGCGILILDPVAKGLATSLIFGTIASTMLTIFVVPILYYLDALRRKKRIKSSI